MRYLSVTRLAVYCALLALLTGVLPENLSAQVLYGSVTGTITDETGAVVPGAKLALVNDQTGLRREVETDAAGIYRVLDLPQGTYTLEAAATGFRPMRKTNISVVIGQVNAQDLHLVVGSAAQEITVQGTAAVLQTQKADVRTEITGEAIRNLPLNVYRNFQAVTLLAPGVFSISALSDSYPNGLASGPERSLSIYSNGLPSRINNTRVDGATSINIFLPDHMLIIPPAETVQEVNVQTASYGVEKGLTAGAATDVVTKSGTNEFHGSLYAFHTDSALIARNFFDFNPTKGKRIHNNDGVTLGGPIVRKKLFFFANWDGYFERKSTAGNGLLAPVDYRRGDYRAALGLPLFDNQGRPVSVCTTEGGTTQLREGMVFDPLTGDRTNATGRCVFSSNGQLNVLPAARLNAGAQKFWPRLREPRIAGPVNRNTPFNDFYTIDPKFNRNIGIAKIDWNRNDRHTIWGKWNRQDSMVDTPMEFGAAGGSSGFSGDIITQIATIGHTWTLSPSMVLTGHFGIARQKTDTIAGNAGEPLGRSVLGVPGMNEPLDDVRYSGMPRIGMDGWTALGNADSSVPYVRRDWTYTISQNLTHMRGRHEFRVGLDAGANYLNHFQPELCCMRGSMDFSQGITSINLPANPATPSNGQYMELYTSATPGAANFAGRGFTTYLQNSVAAFNLGQMSQAQKSLQFIDFNAHSWQYGLYFGDRIKVTPKLTLDLGLRWEYFPLLTRNGRETFERYDPNTNTLLLGGLAGNSKHLGVTTSKKLFAPRAGIAYRVDDNTAVRVGYGIAYDSMPMERPLRGFYPLVIAASYFNPSTFVSGFMPYTDFASGIPVLQGPDLSSGKLTPPGNVEIHFMPEGQFKRGYVQSWNFSIERKLPMDILLNVAYVGNRFVHEMNGRDVNAAPLGTGSAGQPLAKYGRFITTPSYEGYLDSKYHSLQVSVNRRTARGLYLQGSYTWSRTMAYSDDNTYGNALRFNCPPSAAMPEGCLKLNYAPTSFDRAHMLKAAFVWELPFGPGRTWNSASRVLNAIAGGWQLNGIVTGMTGAPLQISQSRNGLNTPGTPQNPFVLRQPEYIKDQAKFDAYSGIYWFNPTAFVPNFTSNEIGNIPRRVSWLRGPGVAQLDASLFRHFRWKERFDFEVRGEAMNVSNSTHYGDPNTTCTVVGNSCLGSFGQVRSAYGQRIVQLGAVARF
ncbi:MAG TPA: TonB-dependent receptor [Bryobacteraceae bacterium]|nr:TonB-dependent receptor [Bryobacteraceae bacterium]